MAPEVREAIEMAKCGGRRQETRTKGSHRRFKHPSRSGRITIVGDENLVPDIEEWRSIVEQSGLPKRGIRESSTWKRWR